MISAVTARGALRFAVFDGTTTAKSFTEFCKRLVHDTPGPVYLIVDGHPAHRSRAVKDYAASTAGKLTLFYLPGYSPELNPDEWVWKNVKHDRIQGQGGRQRRPQGQGHRRAAPPAENAGPGPAFFADPISAISTPQPESESVGSLMTSLVIARSWQPWAAERCSAPTTLGVLSR